MLVIDLHTLEAVNVLYLVDNVLLYGGGTLDGKDVIGSDDTVGEWSSGTHGVVLLHEQLLAQIDKILMGFAVLGRNDDLAVTTLEFAHSDLAIDLRYDCGVRGVAGLEELGNSWETTGDVTSTSYGTWNLNESGTGRYLLSVFYHYVTAYGEVVGTEHIAVGV